MPTRILLTVTIVTFVAAVGAGMTLLGSPAKARERRFDSKRSEDLAAIERAVLDEYTAAGVLPASLTTLQHAAVDQADPITRQPYEYRIIDDTSYELCATFQHPSGQGSPEWPRHGAGRHCFTHRIPEWVERRR